MKLKFLFFLLGLSSFAMAKSVDIKFLEENGTLCATSLELSKGKISEGMCSSQMPSVFSFLRERVRIRIIEPVSSAQKPGFKLERPFLIVDGIHLDPDSPRSLSDFEAEANAYGFPSVLKSLGYTPILVQFPQTVSVSLSTNSNVFAAMLLTLAKQNLIPWPTSLSDGFVILGISQGGILGRYGAYRYDTLREKGAPKVRLFVSLDSPHQGAVVPRGALATIQFWAERGIDSAENFYDLLSNPGAEELLLYATKPPFDSSTSSSRWLFGEYRYAAEYAGFPSILLSEGQIRGKNNGSENFYFQLNREASKLGKTLGRGESSIAHTSLDSKTYAHNHYYKFPGKSYTVTQKGKTPFDFVQGSTYPFGEFLYQSLRDGMKEAIPDKMKQKLLVGSLTLSTHWEKNELSQESSTFIPTTSALDLKCDNDLSVRKKCVETQTEKSLSWEAPGKVTSARAIYAVDNLHPRAKENISGKHIEAPNGKENVLKGIQTDLWRLLCEVAKADYDEEKKSFRNEYLTGFFSPTTSCMDNSKMPALIQQAGVLTEKKFNYARYPFSSKADETQNEVHFTLPAGWQKSVLLDYGEGLPANSIIEAEIKLSEANANWFKAELLLTPQKNGGTPIQLEEKSLSPDGEYYTVRWQLPALESALARYRYAHIILNSAGGKASIKNIRILLNASIYETPAPIRFSKVYPSSSVRVIPWSEKTILKESESLYLKWQKKYDGVFFNFGKYYNLGAYQKLKISYTPGTCQGVRVYFDVLGKSLERLGEGKLLKEREEKEFSLENLIDRNWTPGGTLSASRLILQGELDNESCEVHSILLE